MKFKNLFQKNLWENEGEKVFGAFKVFCSALGLRPNH
jgi:hypothetical protein